ncbi:Phospholipase/Carboxylesterase-domain-containing protein [Chiua virens]|nr:Phospholipase/Carboxylesterase-domain-containing protein [Chiua virens]
MAAARVLPTSVVIPTKKHSATVIFLHGLGDTGLGWRPAVEMIKSELPHVKWLLPTAPTRSITANMGMQMPGWFDILSFDFQKKNPPPPQDRDGLLESARTIDKYIQDEIDAGIPAERIVIGGFSQGGAVSLLAGLTDRGNGGWKLGGVVSLSSWIPLQEEFVKTASPHLRDTPVLMCHGTADPLVPFKLGRRSSEILNSLGLPVLGDSALTDEGKLPSPGLIFRSYDGLEHSACTQTILDLRQFMKRVLVDD